MPEPFASPVFLIDLIEQMAEQLEAAGLSAADGFGQGTHTAFDEAAWLVMWKLDLPLDSLDKHDLLAVSQLEALAVTALIQQRITTRQPAAYITGEAWLMGVPFHVDKRCIIPRSLIAEVLDSGSIDPWLGPHTQRVLDMCTGNGSLAVLAAMTYPDVTVDALDISADALAVARLNIDRHALADRIALLESDGFAACAGRRYDLVLCNPPYVNSASMAALPAEFKAEPALALAGGDDGMDFVRRLLTEVPRYMSENAVLVLEIGNERPYFEKAFPSLQPLWLDTSAGGDQVLLLKRSQLKNSVPSSAYPSQL